MARLTGIGVTLVFTDPSGAAYPRVLAAYGHGRRLSNATVHLEAPTLWCDQGMLIIGDSNIPTDTAFNLQANAVGQGFRGVIYVPTADFTWGGGPNYRGRMYADDCIQSPMQGNATFNNSNCDLSGGGGGLSRLVT